VKRILGAGVVSGVVVVRAGAAGCLLYVKGSSRYRSPPPASVRRFLVAGSTAPDDRDQNAVARSRPVKQVLDAAWPKLTVEQVLFRLLSDAEFFAEAAQGQLTPEEQARLRWPKPYRSWKSVSAASRSVPVR
jgi:hypothetical protein